MIAQSCKFAKVFGNTGHMHHVLPHFQREYRWSQNNWQTLWDDAMLTYNALPRVTGNERVPEHFLGALVTIPVGAQQGTVPVHRLVDGQQRMTTVSLLLRALAVIIQDQSPKLAAQIQSLLVNSNIDGDLRFKVLPTTKNNDRAIYCAIIENTPVPVGSSQTLAAFNFFKHQVEAALTSGKITPEGFFEVLTSAFQLVWVELDKNENAYQIFESLNTKGEKLGEADLVRNYIAMRLPAEKQEKVFGEVWSPIEALLDEQHSVGRSGIGELTAFLRHFDAAQSGILSAKKNTYARFRDANKIRGDADFLDALYELKRFAALYEGLLRPDKGTNSKLRGALQRLNALDISVAYPFLLAIADRHHQGQISSMHFVEACETLENFFVRCFLTNVKSNTYDKMLAALARKIDWNDFLPSLRSALLHNGFPVDSRVRQLIGSRSLYENAGSREKTVMLFERINAHLYAGSDVKIVLDGAPTLEHILPQNPSASWKKELGEELEPVKREWLHTLGNLTLVTQSYNSSLSNDSFKEKQQKLTAHGLKLNSQYFARDIELWDGEAIEERAAWLTEKILEIWPSFEPVRTSVEEKVRTKPTSLTIRGEKTVVELWWQVLEATGEWMIRNRADFADVGQQLPAIVSKKEFPRAYCTLSNSWFINTHFSSGELKRHVKRLLQTQSVSPSEWNIEEKNV